MAAGLGFKTFTTGEVLTAADTNGYLMQGVLVFASAAARDAAITSPQEGQCCYLKDTDAVQTYSGSAWVGFDDSNAIQNSIVDAKGDIVAASGNDTPARLAVGSNGDTLVADSAATTGLSWSPSFGFSAGKNKIINGDCNVNQRAFSSSTTSTSYIVDRFQFEYTGGTTTGSVQAFTAGTAPVTGYEAKQYVELASTSQSAAGDYVLLKQKIESVRTFANQTATLSFWAKASSGTPKVGGYVNQVFGSGGSAAVTTAGTLQTISTSWARYSITISVPSISGKTIGTSDYLEFGLMTSCGTTISALGYPAVGIQNATIGLWGFQIENGSTSTAFQTATGTLQGELAACQRYLPAVLANGSTAASIGSGYAPATNSVNMNVVFQVPARVAPTGATISAASHIQWASTGNAAATVATFNIASQTVGTITLTVTATSGQGGLGYFNNASGSILFTGCEL